MLKADTNLQQRNIMRTIVEGIAQADLIVAELTGNNPNVFYELGVAHGLQQPVVMIAQDVDQIPFDLRSYNVVIYSLDVFEVDDFREALRSLARGKIEGTVQFENPVSDFAPMGTPPGNAPRRYVQHPSVAGGPVAEEETGEPSPEERGILDFTSEVESAILEIGEISQSLTSHMENLGLSIATRSVEVEAVSQSANPGSNARMLKLANEMGEDLKNFSDNTDAEMTAFHSAWERFEDNFTSVLPSLNIANEEDREAAEGLQTIFDDLGEGLSQALEGIDSGRGQFDSLRGISSRLNSAVRRLERTMENLHEEFSTGQSVVIRTRNLLDQKLQDS